jgi:hypothetical protein
VAADHLAIEWMQAIDPAFLTWMARECGNGVQP